MDRHIPGGDFTGDVGRGLVVSDEHIDSLARFGSCEVTGEPLIDIVHHAQVVRPHIEPVGLLGLRGCEQRRIEGVFRQHPIPVRLIGAPG